METNFPSFRLAATRRIKVDQDKGNIPATRRRLVAKRPMEATTSETPSVAPITEASPVTVATTDTPDLVVSSEALTEEPQLTQSPTVSRRKQPTPTVVRRLVNRKRINVARATTVAPISPRRRIAPTTSSPIPEIVEDQDEDIFERKIAPSIAPRRKMTTTARPILDAINDEEEAEFDPLPVNRQPTTTGSVFGKTEGRTRKQQQQLLQTVRQYSFQGVDGTYTYGYETADGSFKEETKQPDCTIIGKYGYREADGTKREFSYHTGLPCKTFP